ncbi:CGNR zinc finger domain-containing protein [Halobacillus salinarum]|uniref:CGNR zinc finger domain-containing protein n=1 Tax=Halobacillus salinarum TaxID=2932257 RepID=A0ABY4EI48_9BACI|nr:CGNR zinc finger domain-containing protein [Halobacillus salinarum]UOQ43738.1 CGNR zinc finger domain-containing protein [Halobacillus salinarum]
MAVSNAGNIRIVSGGNLGLDFINTANYKNGEIVEEWLFNVSDFIDWASHLNIGNNFSADLNNSDESFFEDIIQLRFSMYNIVTALINAREVNEQDVTIFNNWLKRANSSLEIRIDKSGDIVEGYSTNRDLESLLYPVVHSFKNLLESNHIKKVKQCSSDACNWLFIDNTKNKSKQWCTMDVCGNREKAKRHYRAKKNKN